MQKLEVKDQEEEFEEAPGTLRLDIPMARGQHDNENERQEDIVLQANWTIGIKIYSKAGYKAIKNTNKKVQVR